MLVLWFDLFVLVCSSLRTIRLNKCRHQLPIAVDYGSPLAVEQLTGPLWAHHLPLNPLAELIHTLDAAHMPGLLADELGGQPRLAHLLDPVRAVPLIVAQPPRRYLQTLGLQHLAGLLGILAHC